MMKMIKTVLVAASLVVGVAQARCLVTSLASGSDLLLKGTVLTSKGAVPHSCVLVRGGRITYVGTRCSLSGAKDTHFTKATVIDCTSSVISPGFINTHEHLAYSTITPFNDNGERSLNRQNWRLGLQNIPQRNPEVNGTIADATAWGELRHLFSGTTSVIGSEMVPGLARNLDFIDGVEDGISALVDTTNTFPLDDISGPIRNGDCDYGPNADTAEHVGSLYRYLPHIAEGIDAYAANEWKCISNASYDTQPASGGGGTSTDMIAPNVGLIHALALSEADFDLVAARGASVIWSPRSNVFLYGRTLDIQYLLDAGITVALGTDWLPSGSATMAREAVCARDATQASYGHDLEARTLWKMMTINAATVAGFEKHIGSLEVGKLADIVVFGGEEKADGFAQAVFGAGEDIEMVLRGGKMLLAAAEIERATTGKCESVEFGHVSKTVCVEEELGLTYAEFDAKLNGVYPVIYPGVPEGEPSCRPTQRS